MSIELINDECGNTQNKYFYFINCSDMEKELCNMEMKSIFKQIPNRKFLFSNKDFNPSRSPFIKFKVNIGICIVLKYIAISCGIDWYPFFQHPTICRIQNIAITPLIPIYIFFLFEI